MNPFVVRTIKDGEENKYVITVGTSLAVNRKFESQELAEEFLEKQLNQDIWDMIGALALEVHLAATRIANNQLTVEENEN